MQDKTQVAMPVLVAKLNDLFEGDLKPGDSLVYDELIKRKLMDSKRLATSAPKAPILSIEVDEHSFLIAADRRP